MRPAIRERLLDAITGADELVLLGDALELRDLPLARVLLRAEPLLSALGAALRGGRIVLVAGNHDHQLAAPVLRGCGALGLGRAAPARGGAAGAVAAGLGHADVVVSYPGYWIRPDVWATHGHYMDVHTAAATFECVAAAAMQGVRLNRQAPGCAEDYERALVPLYRLFYAIAQRPRMTTAAGAAKRLLRVLERRTTAAQSTTTTTPDGARVAGLMARLGGPTARTGRWQGETRRPGIGPMIEVLRTLGVDAAHVVFGHTHHALQVAAPSATRSQLTSTGSWVLEAGRGALDAGHLPGVVTIVDGDGPPRVERILEDRDFA